MQCLETIVILYFALKCEICLGLSRGSPSQFHVALDRMVQPGAGQSTSKMAYSMAGELVQVAIWELSPVSWGPEFFFMWTSPQMLGDPHGMVVDFQEQTYQES